MDSSESTAPSLASIQFAKGVISRLSIWTTLRIAVQENWGGPHGSAKRTWLASEIVDAFETQNPLPDDQYIEEMLLQVMADEFETVVEDGSAEAVSKDIVRLWDETRSGNQDSVRRFDELAERVKGKRPNAQEKIVSEDEDDWEDDEGEESDESDDEVPQLIERASQPSASQEPQLDEDGFTLVQGKKKK
ncbi:Pre-rRNA-processing protein TSR2-domain-containing protein [Crepidotus variabilis]|uniref:Pre-rRNA-processing protein TSR2-domain-containing protein n=1 Tax=Crepidotus variabilis TaxID=179855 RepID=A0A9P6JS35_9AGAR|nr:Pre-rRNA-processing protein TSR2-domain-containing protein [Crepidotus variabilis]